MTAEAMLLGFDLNLYAISFVVIVVAAVAQSSFGLGFGVVAAPVLALIDPGMLPGPLLVLAMLTSLMVLIRDRKDVRFGNLSYALVGRVVASVLGAFSASMLGEREFMMLFAVLILLAVALSLTGRRVLPTRRNLFLAGSASGYMGTITSVGTPPMALVYQHSPGAEVRANMSAFLTIGALVSILSLMGFDAFDMTEMIFAVSLTPALVLGFLASGYIKTYIDNGWMRPSMLVLCVLASLTLLAKSLAL
ncbi:sulfite exporter TauE/SafE family protein [Oceanibium sediminis]|uniref:sulfite exporter TauE/SafE family protein n=1 Tax=Oceanibium sediminis TaxID=2026339 RepID=UPI000DD450EF|nr:sulfite exporter TauE/SafE family protein [Oceanibium sediminis]